MSNIVHTQISGFAELNSRIQALRNDRQKVSEIRKILRMVAATTVRAAKGFAPMSRRPHKARGKTISPGNLKKSIGTITGRDRVNPTIFVGARAKNGNDGWYAHFVHDGVNTYRKGYRRKRTRGANAAAAVSRTRSNPFFSRAYAATGGLVAASAEVKVAKYFQKRINALSR